MAMTLLRESQGHGPEWNAGDGGMPCFAGMDREGLGQRAGRDDLARGQRRIVRVVGEHIDEVTQRVKRAVEHGGAAAAVDEPVIAIKLRGEGRKFAPPGVGAKA